MGLVSLTLGSCLAGCSDSAGPNAAHDQRTVEFASAAVPFSSGVKEAPTAFRARIEEFVLDPISGSDFVTGRRVVALTVLETYRGSPLTGDRVFVWYGTQLSEGTSAHGEPDLVEPPAVGSEVLVLGSESELPSLGKVVVPLDIVGLAPVVDGQILARSAAGGNAERMPLPDIEKQLRRPAAPAPQPEGNESRDGAPAMSPSRLPSSPPAPDQSELTDVADFEKMLTDLNMTAEQFMSLPPDEQERLVAEHIPG